MASGEIRTRIYMNCRKTAYIVTRTATHSRILLALGQDLGGWLKEFREALRASVERVGFRPSLVVTKCMNISDEWDRAESFTLVSIHSM